MVSTPLSQIAVTMAWLARFTWPTGSANYALWSDDFTAVIPNEGSVAFDSVQSMSVDLGRQHGGTKPENGRLLLPSTLAPADLLIGRRGPKVEITIAEIDPSDGSTYRTAFASLIELATLNPAGRAGLVEYTVPGWKSQLERSLGLSVDSTCPWLYGGDVCEVDLAPLRETAVIDSVTGNVVNVSDAAITGKASRYWHWGSVEVDGFPIRVRDWESGTGLTMTHAVPADWAGRTAIFTPGCRKTLDWCKTLGPHVPSQGSNESRFGGSGRAMPTYNPLFEKGGGTDE